MRASLSSFCVALVASAAPAQELARVRVLDARAPVLAERWERAGLDVLEGSVAAASLELVVDPFDLRRLQAAGFDIELIEIGRPFADIQASQAPPEAPPAGYSTLAQIQASLSATAASYPSICRLVDLNALYPAPATWNGRHIQALVISDNVQQPEDEPAVLIVADYHAREIVTPVIALTAIDRLTSLYATDATVRAAVDAHEIWIVPVCNPDGYDYVFTTNNLWRKNRRNNGGGVYGVDLNRNHAFGWSAACGGSTSPSSDTYRGPAAESEPEVQTIVALASDRRFAKVLDYHSSGREVLYAYSCSANPWAASFWASEAAALAAASGYATIRPPTAEGEHYEWELVRGGYSFLIETHDQFQPSYASAQAEAAQLWPGIQAMLARPISLTGHVTDACSLAPLDATITLANVSFSSGESWSSGGSFGRYDVIAPAGSYSVRFSAPGYVDEVVQVTLTAQGTLALDVALDRPQAWSSYCTAGTTSNGCVATLAASGIPSASGATSFAVTASSVEGAKSGLLFYGTSGPQASPWAMNSSSFMCVAPPRQRTGTQTSTGNAGACDGELSIDWSAYVASNPSALGVPFAPGDRIWIQAWFRDPPAAKGTSLSNAIEATVCP
jgi:hypothetical protein